MGRRKNQPDPKAAAASSGGGSGYTLNYGQGPTSGSPSSPCDAAVFLQSLQDAEIIERVRATIQNAHVFKLPPRQSASVGWRGADWKDKVWQGTVKVVERGDLTAVLLVDRTKGSIFAVCPVKEGSVDRCVDSSRYFVLRIENANGRHMFIGVAFNERNDAFDFNTALEDSRREREAEKNPVKLDFGPPKDYSIKDGEKIKISIKKGSREDYKSHGRKHAPAHANGNTFLRPSSRDTPTRGPPGSPAAKVASPKPKKKSSSHAPKQAPPDFSKDFFDAADSDPFPTASFGQTENPFKSAGKTLDQSTGSGHPFFASQPNSKRRDQFDPRNYKTEH